MALGEAQLVPLAHDVAAAHFAELVGGQAADVAEQLEPRHGLAHYAFGEHGVAIDHGDHGAVVRQVAGDGAETEGQAVALAGAGDAHEVELDPCSVGSSGSRGFSPAAHRTFPPCEQTTVVGKPQSMASRITEL